MATELVPNQGIISLDNYVMGLSASLLSVTSEAPLYPGLNLLNQLRSKRWRSTGVGSVHYLTFDLGSPVKPTVFALIDCNLDTGKSVAVQSSATADFAVPYTYTYTTYTQAFGNRILRFFVGNPDSVSAVAHQYWRVKIAANSQAAGYSYFEVGLVWFGVYTELDIDVDLQMTIDDKAETETAYNGARYSDVIRTMRTVGLSFSMLDLTTLYGLKDKFDQIGASRHIFVDIFANTTNATQKPHGSFYGTVGGKGATISQKLQLQGNLEIDLEEAVG